MDAARLLGLDSADGADLVTGDLARLDAGADDVVVKVAVPLTGVAGVLTAARTVEQQHGVACRVQGSAGVGVLYAVLSSGEGVARGTSGKARARQSEPGEADPVAASIEVLRAAAAGGSAVVLQAPASVRSLVDSWGPVAALDVMRRVKAEFDPEHRFAPGRFVGGI